MNKLFAKYNLRNLAIILLIAIFFVGDLFLKRAAASGRKPFGLIGDFFSFSFTPNYFIAFSLPLSGKILEGVIFILIITMIIFFFYLVLRKKSLLLISGLSSVLLGAISNFIDRLRFGYVVDYLYLKHFTVFNLGDVLIVIGTILIFIYLNKKTDR